MEKELLNLKPKRVLCPYCGEWHEWDKIHELGYYDSCKCKARFWCPDVPSDCNEGDYRVFFKDGYCYYSTEQQCLIGGLNLEGKVAIASITESADNPIVTFKVPFKPHWKVGGFICSGCGTSHICNILNLADKGNSEDMEITFGFEFEQSDYDELAQSAILERKKRKLRELENAMRAKERELQERENVLKDKEQPYQESGK